MRSRNDLLSRLTALLLAFSLLFSLAACGPAAADTTAEAETAGKGTTLSAAESAEVPVSLSVKESLAIKESLAVMESPGPVESISIRESSAARPGTAQAASLIEGITPEEVSGKEADETFTASQYRFAAELFRRSYEEDKGNCLISPLSVILALAMTANGAEGDTLAQMLRVLGDGMSLDDLNAYLYAYVHSLPSTEKAKLAIANSLWLNDRKDFSVREAFLRADASWYDAAVYKLPFDDSAVGEVNGWVAQKTDRMITEIIDKLEEDARMLLINAICFDAKWAHPYADYSVQSGTFTKTDGTQQTVSMMWSEEFNYYEGADYTGFAKYYDGNTYKFVAILPDKNVPIDTFAASLLRVRPVFSFFSKKVLTDRKGCANIFDVRRT